MSNNAQDTAPYYPSRTLYAVQLFIAAALFLFMYSLTHNEDYAAPTGSSYGPGPGPAIALFFGMFYAMVYLPIIVGWIFLLTAIYTRLRSLRWPPVLTVLGLIPGLNAVFALLLLFKLKRREDTSFDKDVWVDIARGDISGLISHYTTFADFFTDPLPDTSGKKDGVPSAKRGALEPSQVSYLICLAVGVALKLFGQMIRFDDATSSGHEGFLYYLGYTVQYLGTFVMLAGIYRRLKDIQWTPFLTLLFFFPVANAILILLLMFRLPKGPEKPFDKKIWSELAHGNAKPLMDYLLEKDPEERAQDKKDSVFPDPKRYETFEKADPAKSPDSGKDPDPPTSPPPVKKNTFTGTPTVQRKKRW